MKKFLLGVVTFFAVFLLVGCGNSKADAAYNNAMDRGKTAIKDANYSQAVAYFQSALDNKKSDKKAQTYLDQTQDYADAESKIKDYKFTTAQTNLKSVTKVSGGSSTLVSRADSLIDTLDTVIKNVKSYNTAYKSAKADYDKQDYQNAANTLTDLLGESDISKDYYQNIRQKALDLQTKINTELAKQASTAASNSAADSSNPASNSPENQVTESDKTVSGKTITAAQIQAAREQLRAQGTNPDYWSDLDIMHAIQHAAKEGRTTITAKDAVNN